MAFPLQESSETQSLKRVLDGGTSACLVITIKGFVETNLERLQNTIFKGILEPRKMS